MSTDHLIATAETLPYWQAAAREELAYQFCPDCDAPQFPPRERCAGCASDRVEWRVSCGRGVIESCSVVHRAPNPEFRAKAPYLIALVRLEEGFRIMVNLIGASAPDARVGLPVRIVFETRADGVVLPQAEVAA